MNGKKKLMKTKVIRLNERQCYILIKILKDYFYNSMLSFKDMIDMNIDQTLLFKVTKDDIQNLILKLEKDL